PESLPGASMSRGTAGTAVESMKGTPMGADWLPALSVAANITWWLPSSEPSVENVVVKLKLPAPSMGTGLNGPVSTCAENDATPDLASLTCPVIDTLQPRSESAHGE